MLMLKERGSPHRMWEEVVPLLRARSVEPVVGSVFPSVGLEEQLARLGVAGISLNCTRAADYPRAATILARWLRRHDVDVVHGTEPIAGCVGGLAGRLAGTPVRIFHRQHLAFESDKLTWLSRIAAHLNDVVLACSSASARAAMRLDRVPARRTMVAHNGANELRPVADAELAELRHELRIEPTASVISAVARLDRVKGIDLLVEALPAVRAHVSTPVHVVVAGEGEERAALTAQARACGVATAFHFVGQRQDIAPWIALGDVVAMPSRREAFGVAAAEAMSYGKPLVVSNVGGLPELVDDGVSGLIVAPNNPSALAIALSTLLVSPDEAAELGRAARQRFLENFTNERMVDAWLACYDAAERRR